MAESRRLKSIAVSIELWQQIATQGWTVGDEHTITCTRGLPAFAKFRRGYWDADLRALVLVFEDESFPEVGANEPAPFLDVVYEQRRIDGHGREKWLTSA